MDDRWVFDRSTEDREAARSLELFVEMLNRAEEDSFYWKWAIFAIHSALHGFFVLVLRGTWPVRLLKTEDARKAIARQHGGEFDSLTYEAKIAPFMELYERVKDKNYMSQFMDSKSYHSSDKIDGDIRRLNDLRNEMMHYRSMLYIRAIEHFIGPCKSALDVIDFLHKESGNILWRSSDDPHTSYEDLVTDNLARGYALLDRAGQRGNGELE